MTRRIGSVFAKAALCLAVLAAGPASASAQSWAFLKGSYWTVPQENLLAYAVSPKLPAPLPSQDQTVYHITDYHDGFFWGSNVTSINGNITCATLLGSVTPDGRVLLSFVSTASDGSTSQQVGYGQMTQSDDAWTMLNQTAAPNFAHWAYMVQSRPGDASWARLPGVRQSVPEFLGQCGGS
jgi:hypothetical protein